MPAQEAIKCWRQPQKPRQSDITGGGGVFLVKVTMVPKSVFLWLPDVYLFVDACESMEKMQRTGSRGFLSLGLLMDRNVFFRHWQKV